MRWGLILIVMALLVTQIPSAKHPSTSDKHPVTISNILIPTANAQPAPELQWQTEENLPVTNGTSFRVLVPTGSALDFFSGRPFWFLPAIIVFLASGLALAIRLLTENRGLNLKPASRQEPAAERDGFSTPPSPSPPHTLADDNPHLIEENRSEFVLLWLGNNTKIALPRTSLEHQFGLTIGRSRAFSDVSIDSNEVSRRHARLQLHGDDLSVEDLSSTNGTFIDGKILQRFEKTPLRSGQTLKLGEEQFEFVAEA